MEMEKNLHESMPPALLLLRGAVRKSTCFRPLELVYRHEVMGPLSMLKEKRLGPCRPPSSTDTADSLVSSTLHGRGGGEQEAHLPQGFCIPVPVSNQFQFLICLVGMGLATLLRKNLSSH